MYENKRLFEGVPVDMDLSFSAICKDMKEFSSSESYTYLKERSRVAPLLNDASFLLPSRLSSCFSRGGGMTLWWGFQKIDDAIMEALYTLANERKVFEQMEALYFGEKVNTLLGYSSEDRSVLHPATRDLFASSPRTPEFARKASSKELDKLSNFFQQPHEWTDLVLIGIGGSELGPHALIEALRPEYLPNKKVHFVSNVDPDEMTFLFETLDLSKTLVAVVSKSGTTLETATNEARARSFFQKQNIDSQPNFVAITQPKTPMDDLTKYREVFYIYEYVGGRFSSTSMVGGVLISFLTGFATFIEVLQGASMMDYASQDRNLRNNPALTLALIGIWNRNFLQYPTLAIIPYSQGLKRFVAHIQQCDMESNGKSIQRDGSPTLMKTGPIIWGEPGTNAQHSFFQLLHQGTDRIPVDFIGFSVSQDVSDFMYQGSTSHEKLLANLLAQALALAQGKDDPNPNKRFEGDRPSNILSFEALSPRSLGSLLSLYENKIAFQGFFWGINSFDQEGVQLGKVLSERLLDAMKMRKTTDHRTGGSLFDVMLDMFS